MRQVLSLRGLNPKGKWFWLESRVLTDSTVFWNANYVFYLYFVFFYCINCYRRHFQKHGFGERKAMLLVSAESSQNHRSSTCWSMCAIFTTWKKRLFSVGECGGGVIWENSTETCIPPYVKQRTSPISMHGTGHSKPVHWDNPEG